MPFKYEYNCKSKSKYLAATRRATRPARKRLTAGRLCRSVSTIRWSGEPALKVNIVSKVLRTRAAKLALSRLELDRLMRIIPRLIPPPGRSETEPGSVRPSVLILWRGAR
jgi:hypothetical protein